jgi:hypothetical protein
LAANRLRGPIKRSQSPAVRKAFQREVSPKRSPKRSPFRSGPSPRRSPLNVSSDKRLNTKLTQKPIPSSFQVLLTSPKQKSLLTSEKHKTSSPNRKDVKTFNKNDEPFVQIKKENKIRDEKPNE